MEKLSSSFRDPSGYVYEEGGELYRQVLPPGVPSLERLMGSGLATRLMERAELAGFTLHGESALGPVLRLGAASDGSALKIQKSARRG